MRPSRLLLTLPSFILLACSVLLRGQDAECRERTLIANVTDHTSQPRDLTLDNFQITYRGRRIAPHNAYYSEGPRRVVVLLDVSGSMRGEQGNPAKWRIARVAAWSIAASLPPGSRVALIKFSAKAEVQVPLSTNREAIANWLNRDEERLGSLRGRTALYDAIELGLAQLQPPEAGDAIYVITDGGENASNAAQGTVKRALRESGVRLFTTILAPNDAHPDEFNGRRDLVSVAQYSGGSESYLDVARLAQELDERLVQLLRSYGQRMALQISSFYALSVELPDNPEKPTHWLVRVVNTGKRRQNVLVGYPHDVPPCHSRLAQK